MVTTPTKLISVGVLFLCTLLSGFRVSSSGKPYSVFILTIHKLISLGALIYLVVTVLRANRSVPLSPTMWLVSGLTGLLFAGTIATGGMLSTESQMPPIVKTLHHVTPYLTTVGAGIGLYLLGGA